MGLTDEQALAIHSTIPNKILLAGPGTGKSFTILSYVNHLINEKNIDPTNIFILTFTRAATYDLKKNIQKELNSSENLPNIFTLHGFALRQLMKNSRRISSLPKDFVIADDFSERHIILEDLKQILNLSKIKDVQNLFNLLSANWETLNADSDDWESNFDNPEFIGAWKEHRAIYGYVLRAELVYQFKNMLENEDEISIDGPIEYLIVDEYQDLNKCDLQVIKNLYQRESNLFCAGDDDQSIYGFRYAYPEGIRRFTEDIENSDQFPITECRRCDKNILKLSMNVIRQDFRRIPKNLVSVTAGDGHVNLLRFSNQIEEANKIADIIDEIKEKNIANENEIIILLRSDFRNCFSQIISEAMLNKDICINENSQYLNVFDSNEGRFLISICKLIENKMDDLALRTILQLCNGIGPSTITSIYTHAKEKNIRFHDVVDRILKEEIDDINNKKRIIEYLTGIFDLIKEIEESDDTFELILDQVFSLIPNCDDNFKYTIINLVDKLEITSLKQLVSLVNDILGPVEPIEDAVSGVRIMSMHQAKGLTAKVVFVVAVEDEYIPGRGDIDEERRLLYVSLTRAKHYLFITYCSNRTGQQSHTGHLRQQTARRTLTRFLSDIPSLTSIRGSEYTL